MRTKIYLGQDKRSTQHPYYVKWYGEPDPDTGKQPIYYEHFATEKAAEIFRKEKELAQAKDKNIDRPTGITLRQFCKDFLDAKQKKRQGTIKLYENTIQRLLCSKVLRPDMEIARVTPRLAEKFVTSLMPMNGQGELSTSAEHRVIRHCVTMFEKAIIWKYRTENPFKAVERPQVETRPWYYLKPKEYHRLLSKVTDLQTKAFYALCYTAGLRLGEATSLLWSDIDLSKAEVVVRNREGTADIPPFDIKDHEKRTIPLPKHTVDLLGELQSQRFRSPFVVVTGSRYEKVQTNWKECRRRHKPWQNRYMLNNVLRHLKKHLRAAGIKPGPGERLSVHDLRKAAILNWAKVNRNPKVTQVWAGHSDLKTTMQYYSQVTDDQRQMAVKALDQMLDVA